jgi:RHS repeat-associated protein
VDDLASVTSDYSYDSIYELTQVTQSASTTESYAYDPVGDRTSSLGVSSYTTNASNELTLDSDASYAYDYNGNTTSKTDSAGTTTYAWDYENRLTSATLPDSGGTVTFKYDPLGRRIYKQSPSTTSIFTYDGDNLIETVNSSGSVVARYTQTINVDEPLAELRSGGTSYYEADGLGSITSLTGSSGSIADSYAYDSFGTVTNSTGTLSNPIRYAAREFDSETDLYFDRARYYDSDAGRFLSEDPLGFVGGDANLYAYVWNSPLGYVDPDGTWGVGLSDSASAGVGEGFGGVAEISGGAGVFGGTGGAQCNTCSNSAHNSPVNAGIFGSGGSFFGLGPHGPRAPDPPGSRKWNNGYVLGLGASIGGGLFGTNAKSVCDLKGPFKSLTIGAGELFGGELTIAWSHGTYFVSLHATVSPLPFPSGSISLINTNTIVKPLAGDHCGCNH